MNATIHNFNNAEKRTISAEGHIVPALSLITNFHSQTIIILKSASNLNGNLNCSKELEHYAS